MKTKFRITAVVCIVFCVFAPLSTTAQNPPHAQADRDDQVSIVQISDTHLGDHHAPHAADNLKQAVKMINQMHPDAVILSGDIGEKPQDWDEARSILKNLKAPLHCLPGNHDVHSRDVERYRNVFGKDYYDFQVKFVRFVVIDSELLGNYDVYEAKSQGTLSPETEDESERMLSWLNGP
jgi:predicted MPP superfamily phosphohydrolase